MPLQSGFAACLPLDSLSGLWVTFLGKAGQPRGISVITLSHPATLVKRIGRDLGTLPDIWAEISEGRINVLWHLLQAWISLNEEIICIPTGHKFWVLLVHFYVFFPAHFHLCFIPWLI